MRAAVINEHGSRDVVRVVDDLPVPEPGAGQVRVAVKAAALNRLDLWVREGWKGLNLHFPHIIGSDGAGVIDAVGVGVTGFSPGERVCINPTVYDDDCITRTGSEDECLEIRIMGEHMPGLAAEYVVVPVRCLLLMPGHVAFTDAAAAGLVFITAWHSLVTRAGIRPGETVLVVGASGGVNTASIQIGKFFGCRVIVVGSSAEKCRQARDLGADEAIDRSADPNWSKAVYQLTNRRGANIVVDNVGQATLPDSLRAAARGGRVLIVGNTSGPQAQIDTRYVFGKHLSILGSTMGRTRDYQQVMGLIFEGRLRAVVSHVLPLEQAAEAERLLEAGDVFGKVVLDVAGDRAR